MSLPGSSGTRTGLDEWLLKIWPLVALLALWWAATEGDWFGNDFVLASPAAVASRAADLWQAGTLRTDLLVTAGRILASFGLAVVVGVPVGLLMGRVRLAQAALRPVVAFTFPIPKIALFPTMVILLGLGSASKIALGFAEAVFPIVLATTAAASQVPRPLLWSARSAGLGGLRMVRVLLPAAMPGILSGARIGLIGAVIGVFVGEMVVSDEGLGHLMVLGWRQLETDTMYVAVVAISVLGFLADRLLRGLTARLVH